jgi:peroxiredoxin
MKLTHMILATVFAAVLSVHAEVEIGKPAPDFTVKDIHGKSHQLSEYQGKIVVLEAYNLDCPFCANHFKTGAMQELQGDLTGKGVVWLVVNSTHRGSETYRDPASARKEFAQQKMKATAWIDDSSGQLGKKYGMKTTPHMFVIDQNGVLAYQGAIDDRPTDSGDPRKARNYVREAVGKLLSGAKVTVTQTKPYGCGIKYAN